MIAAVRACIINIIFYFALCWQQPLINCRNKNRDAGFLLHLRPIVMTIID